MGEGLCQRGERQRAFVRVAGRLAPLADLVDEVGVGLGDPGVRLLLRHLQVVAHRGAEGGLVVVGRPHLEDVVVGTCDGPAVEDQRRHGVGVLLPAVLLHHQLGGVQQQLERGEPLLPVDNVAHVDEPDWHRSLLDDDRAEEVRRDVRQVEWAQVGRLDQPLGDGPDVVPERLPLILLIPDVWSLEERDHIAGGAGEELERRQRLRLHES